MDRCRCLSFKSATLRLYMESGSARRRLFRISIQKYSTGSV